MTVCDQIEMTEQRIKYHDDHVEQFLIARAWAMICFKTVLLSLLHGLILLLVLCLGVSDLTTWQTRINAARLVKQYLGVEVCGNLAYLSQVSV